jgi:release factor glutamine methyltransferase
MSPAEPILPARLDVPVRRRLAGLVDHHISHTSPYQVAFHGLELRLQPGVFCPTLGEGSRLLAEALDRVKPARVLDIGTGSGALALVAARNGATTVVATDIVPEAVKTARDNAERLGLSARVEVRQGDLFGPMAPTEEFEVIVFNPPFMRVADHYGVQADTRAAALLITAAFDDDNVLERFLAEARPHVASDGHILLAYSSIGDLTAFRRECDKRGLDGREIARESFETMDFFVFKLSFK